MASTFFFGITISTFFIIYHADADKVLILMDFVQEEYYKRSNGRMLYAHIKEQKERYLCFLLDKIHNIDSTLAWELRSIRWSQWK